MNKKIITAGLIVILVVIGAISLFMNNRGTTTNIAPAVVSQTQTTSTTPPAPASSTVPLMQNTGALFSQYQYLNKAHEIFPTLAADTKAALGAFSYTKENLGNNTYRFTLTNNTEGYKGQSVVISGDQSAYFIERSSGDDSDSEDSVTADDFLVAVDAQGYILK